MEIMTDGPKILIVDDEVDICYILRLNLKKRNFSTTFTHTLEGAEKHLEADEPSILLLDNHLPDGYGINFISKVKRTYPDIKIVMITAHDSPQDRAKAYNNGADFFLSKPFAITEINRVVDLALADIS